MNFPSNEIFLETQRGRQWSPLITQQIRLRHINQILCYNVASAELRVAGGFYFTLHLTAMSAPFYTSNKVNGPHPKWPDLQFVQCPSVSAFVLRIWKQDTEGEQDTIILTWGICLSGLIYIGSKIADIQSSLFNLNAVIFCMFGGYFISYSTLKNSIQKFPNTLVDSLNLVDSSKEMKVCKYTLLKFPKSDIKRSYNVEKLRRLHYLEVQVKNKSLDVQSMKDKIRLSQMDLKSEQREDSSLSTKHAPQLLTMNCLNRMMQEKPTQVQKQKMCKTKKEIEWAKFKSKLLGHECDRKLASIRQLREKFSKLVEANEEKESDLMENYHLLSREKEKIREYLATILRHRELIIHTNCQLEYRKRQLLQQLLYIYSIHGIGDTKFTINGIHLPNSESLLDCSDIGISVALGYVTHILIMCSSFLQVPLRYSMEHYGSRSHILDHILHEKDREFPLYTKGKDRMQFTYAVYLLNKNIAQLRWLHYMNTPDLRLTLSNLLGFLQGYREYKQDTFMMPKILLNETLNRSEDSDNGRTSSALANSQKSFNANCFGSNSNIFDPILDSIRQEKQVERSSSPTFFNQKKAKGKSACCGGGGLVEILAIPEAYLNKQISSDSLKNYVVSVGCKMGEECGALETKPDEPNFSKNITKVVIETSQKNCDKPSIVNLNPVASNHAIEQGTDLLDPTVDFENIEIKTVDAIGSRDANLDSNHRTKNTSVESSLEEDSSLNLQSCSEVDSEVMLNISDDVAGTGVETAYNGNGFLENWLNTGPALVCSDENLYPHEYLGVPVSVQNSGLNCESTPLTARTNALLSTKSFNLVKSKHQNG